MPAFDAVTGAGTAAASAGLAPGPMVAADKQRSGGQALAETPDTLLRGLLFALAFAVPFWLAVGMLIAAVTP